MPTTHTYGYSLCGHMYICVQQNDFKSIITVCKEMKFDTFNVHYRLVSRCMFHVDSSIPELFNFYMGVICIEFVPVDFSFYANELTNEFFFVFLQKLNASGRVMKN